MAVTGDVFEEARRRDPECRRRWVVVLVDGDRHQIARIRAEAKRRGMSKDVTLVVDFIHVLEYLWDAAWCFFAEGDENAEEWVTERAFAILQGRSSEVAGGIRRSATKRGLPSEKRKGSTTARTTSSPSGACSITTATFATGCPSPRVSSRAPAATSSSTAQTARPRVLPCSGGAC